MQYVLIVMMCSGLWCTSSTPVEIGVFPDKESCLDSGKQFDLHYYWVCGIKKKETEGK